MYLEKTIIWKHSCPPVFIAALFTIAWTWRQPQCPVCVCVLSCVQLFATSWTAAQQNPVHGIFQARIMEQVAISFVKMPRGTDKDVVYIYIHNGMFFSHIKEWNDAMCSYIDGCRDYHIKWSQRHIIWYHLYVESRKNSTNELTYKTEIETGGEGEG